MNNKLKTMIVVAVVALLGIGAVVLKNNNSATQDHMANNDKMTNKTETTNTKVEESNMVTYKGFDVVQKSIKIKKGSTVTWTNEDNAKHDVTPDVDTADFKASDLFGKGGTRTATFNTVGKYTYYCSPHPYMKGTIEVTE